MPNKINMFGTDYYLKPKGYWVSQFAGVYGSRYLHREVWAAAHGKIPPGCHIHHINHDESDFRLENLECIGARMHAKYHSDVRKNLVGPEQLHTWLEKAREAAKVWHASEEGRAWHKSHAKAGWTDKARASKVEQRVCAHCEQQYIGTKNFAKRSFCSPACQSAARRKSGIDNVDRNCAHCGKVFRSNRYSKIKNCSRQCGYGQG